MFKSISLITVFVVVVVVASLVSAGRHQNLNLFSSSDSGKKNCGIVAAPCNQRFADRNNQTFAFQDAGRFVQLKSWFGRNGQVDDACISTTNSTPLDFYYTVCASRQSLWRYGPKASSIKGYVYYNNTNGLCLTRSALPASNETKHTFSVYLSDCCKMESGAPNKKANCTSDDVERQMWLEKPVTTDPYNRINSQKLEVVDGKNSEICLTRVSGSC